MNVYFVPIYIDRASNQLYLYACADTIPIYNRQFSHVCIDLLKMKNSRHIRIRRNQVNQMQRKKKFHASWKYFAFDGKNEKYAEIRYEYYIVDSTIYADLDIREIDVSHHAEMMLATGTHSD